MRAFSSSSENCWAIAYSFSRVLPDAGALGSAGQYPHQTCFVIKGVDNYGKPVVTGKGKGRSIHDAQVAGDDLIVADGLETPGLRVLLGILGVDPVDLRALEQHVAAQLDRLQRRRRIGG